MTLVSMPQWPPISAGQYPEGMPPELVALLPGLHAACVMVTSAVYEHELYRAFGRDQSFLDRVNGTDVAPAIGLLRACISDSLILTVASLFKSDPRAVNLRHILNKLCDPLYTDFFVTQHQRLHPPLNTEHQRARLVRMHRRLNREPLRGCIQRLDDLRDQGVAHVDLSPKPDFEWPFVRDVSVALAAAGNITITALHYMTWRRFDVRASRQHGIMLRQAFLRAVRP
jgi:hypothetical protein